MPGTQHAAMNLILPTRRPRPERDAASRGPARRRADRPAGGREPAGGA